jgi:hypothetical protein
MNRGRLTCDLLSYLIIKPMKKPSFAAIFGTIAIAAATIGTVAIDSAITSPPAQAVSSTSSESSSSRSSNRGMIKIGIIAAAVVIGGVVKVVRGR